jgi:hypothetical protein
MRYHVQVAVILASTLAFPALAGENVRFGLRRMKGYTIVDAATVSRVLQDNQAMKKLVCLDNGAVYQIESFEMDPMVGSDVIVFAKPLPAELREKFKELPPAMLLQYKLMIDRELYDATYAP